MLGAEGITATCGFGEDASVFGDRAQFGEAGITLPGGRRTVRTRSGSSEQLDGDVVLAAVGIVEGENVADFRVIRSVR